MNKTVLLAIFALLALGFLVDSYGPRPADCGGLTFGLLLWAAGFLLAVNEIATAFRNKP